VSPHKAAVRAVGLSAVLRVPLGASAPDEAYVLRAWLLALDALEDDDDDVRAAMAALLSPILAPAAGADGAIGYLGLHEAVLYL
jgi:hypothetical protein